MDRNEKETASPDGEELLRIIVESSTDFAIFVMDSASTVISWNIGAERMTGYAEHEILGRSDDVILAAALSNSSGVSGAGLRGFPADSPLGLRVIWPERAASM